MTSRGAAPGSSENAPRSSAASDARILAVARGDEPANVVFRGGRLANVLSGEIEPDVDVAVAGTRVAGVGRDYEADRIVELDGDFLLPGFLDAHVHVESSLVTPREFARAVVPRGTTTAVTDPHEMANVHGLDGIRYMLDDCGGVPLSMFVMASSCVPATDMSTTGAELTADDLEELAADPRVPGLAEVMNFPGVIHGEKGVLEKLGRFQGRVVDGHAPGVAGRALSAYVAAGPSSDHECTTAEEATEKIRRGMTVFFREATNASNLEDLLPALTPANRRRVALCTDDRQPGDLLDEGGIDHMLRVVIQAGVPPLEALRLATLNPAEHFGLRDRGAVAPGRRADLVVVKKLDDLRASRVWSGGAEVAREGKPVEWALPSRPPPPSPSQDIPWESVSFALPVRGDTARVIEIVPDQLVTRAGATEPTIRDERVVADPARDLLKIAVVERHHGTGRVGMGLVRGMGLEEGAMAGTVAHDHHNLVTVGADDASMMTACRAAAETDGGLVVARGSEILARLPLPVGGLMSLEPVEDVRRRLDAVNVTARALGSHLHDPFMAMSFLGLEVIPSLKITDRGLVDVDRFELVDLWV